MEQERIERIEQVLRCFCRTFQIPVSLWDGVGLHPCFRAAPFEPDPALFFLRHALESDPEKIQIMARNEIFCGFVRIDGSGFSVLAGPVGSGACTDAHHTAVLKEMGQSFARKAELRRLLQKAPVMDRAHFIALLTFFSSLFNGDAAVNGDAAASAKDVDLVEVEDTRSAETGIKTQDVFHNTQQLETEILHAISAGDTQRLMQILPGVQGSDASAGSYPGGPVRTMKNIFVTAAALCSRAAVAGGMDYDHALTLSDNYITKVEQIKNVDEIPPQIGMMMVEYCEQVAKLRQPQNCSALTKQIVADVHAHLHGPVTVEEIAERCHLSVSYITHTFSKEMGLSPKAYIRQQKIEEAKRLLATSGRPIAEIASLLGFSSQAHFQTVFRKAVGTTPHAYRNEQSA